MNQSNKNDPPPNPEHIPDLTNEYDQDQEYLDQASGCSVFAALLAILIIIGFGVALALQYFGRSLSEYF